MRSLYESTYKQGRGYTPNEWWSAVSAVAVPHPLRFSLAEVRRRFVEGRDRSRGTRSCHWPAYASRRTRCRSCDWGCRQRQTLRVGSGSCTSRRQCGRYRWYQGGRSHYATRRRGDPRPLVFRDVPPSLRERERHHHCRLGDPRRCNGSAAFAAANGVTGSADSYGARDDGPGRARPRRVGQGSARPAWAADRNDGVILTARVTGEQSRRQ